jgi:nucleotide-binding universal stress UspA family protein
MEAEAGVTTTSPDAGRGRQRFEVSKMLSKRILIAYDGSEQAKRALFFAVELAKLAHAKIGVVSVVPVHAGRIGIDPWDDRYVHTEELVEAKRLIAEAGLTPELHEPFGEISEAIVQVAETGDYDHIVTGSRHLGLVQRTLQGSVSEAIVEKFPATVTVVH